MTCEIWQGTRFVAEKEVKTIAEGVSWIKSKVCAEACAERPFVLDGVIFDGSDIVWTGKRVQGVWIEEEVEE